MAKQDARKLKAEAQAAVDKGKHRKALECYLALEQLEAANGDWPRRAADCMRRLDLPSDEVAALQRAVHGYARAGFLVRAIAMCKRILQIDPNHREALVALGSFNAAHGIPAREAMTALGLSPLPPPRPAVPPAATAVAPAPRAVPPPPPMPAPRARAVPPPPPRPAVPPAATAVAPARRAVPAPPLPAPPARAVPPAAPPARLPGEPADGARGDASTMPRTIPRGACLADVRVSQVLESVELELELGEPSGIYQIPLGAPSGVFFIEVELDEDPRDADASAAPGRRAQVHEAARAALPQTPLFSELSPESLAELIARVELVELEPGARLFAKGDPADGLYVVAEGAVALFDDASGGAGRSELGRFGEGEFFGEVAMLTGAPRRASAVALEVSSLLRLSMDVFGELVEREPGVLNVLLRFVRDRLIAQVMSKNPLFAPFDASERRALAGRFRFLEFDAGAALVSQGSKATGLFVLLAGNVDALRADTDGASRRLAELGPGDVFGEMSLITQRPAVATIRAMTRGFALELPERVFRETIMTHPQLLALVGTLAHRRGEQNAAIAAGGGDYEVSHVELM